TDGTIDWLWPAAERAGLPIAMMAAGFLPKVGEVAQRHPNLKLILDHLGRPSGVTSPAERWANLPEVLALAKYPNVAMKATGAPCFAARRRLLETLSQGRAAPAARPKAHMGGGGSLLPAGAGHCPPAAGPILGAAGRHEPGPPVAAAGQARRSPRPPGTDLWLVHGGL